MAGRAAHQDVGGAGGVVRRLVAGQAGTSPTSADGVGAGPTVRATANHSGLAAA